MRIIGLLGIICFFLAGCKEDKVYTPKPRMYPRVMYPEKAYEPLTMEGCNFTFEKPVYTKINRDVNFFEEEALHPCWFDLKFKDLNGALYFSYTPIDNNNTIEKLVSDAFRIVQEHNVKAEYRDEKIITNQYGANGLKFNIEGPVASPVNFYFTDEKNHFLRAALYFKSKVNPDSLAPILNFVEEDINHIIETFKWTEDAK